MNRLWWILFSALIAVYCYLESGGTNDFFIYMNAAVDLPNGVDIYRKEYIDGYHYYYSILFAWLLQAFTSLPFRGVNTVWLMINSGLVIHLVALMMRSSLVKALPDKKRSLFLILVLLFACRFVRDTIHVSQVSILLLWLSVYGLVLIHRGRPVAGGALIAAGINLKLMPLVLLPYLVYRREWKAALSAILTWCILMALPSLLIGHGQNMNLLSSWWWLVNPTNTVHVLDVEERSFHSLSTLLATLLVKDVPDLLALPIRRHIADIPVSTLTVILNAARALLIVATLLFLRTRPFQRSRSEFHSAVEVSYILLLVPLIFPHQQSYGFIFCVPACACLLYTLMWQPSGFRKRLVITVMSFSLLTFMLKLILGEFNAYYDHFKILTYGALALVPLMISVRKWEIVRIVKPDNETQRSEAI